MANPLVRLLVKQIEESSVMIEQHVKSMEWANQTGNKMRTFDTFDQFHAAMHTVKELLQEALFQ